MNVYGKLGKLFLSIFLTMVANLAKAGPQGPGLSGGGNWQEADFTMTARALHKALLGNRIQTQETLGINLDHLGEVITSTEVHCATGGQLDRMRKFNKKAYFEASLGNIFLDCERYNEIAFAGPAKGTVILHEYMRKMVGEGSEYSVSSGLAQIILNVTVNVIIPSHVHPPRNYSFEKCVSIAESHYSQDDKVEAKWACVKNFKSTLTFNQCFGAANSHYREANKVKMKKTCFNITTNLEECFQLAHSNYSETDKVDMKAACLKRFEGHYDIDQCLSVAESNYGEKPKTRMRNFCLGAGNL